MRSLFRIGANTHEPILISSLKVSGIKYVKFLKLVKGNATWAYIFILFGATAIPKFAKSLGQAKKEFEDGIKDGEKDIKVAAKEEKKESKNPLSSETDSESSSKSSSEQTPS